MTNVKFLVVDRDLDKNVLGCYSILSYQLVTTYAQAYQQNARKGVFVIYKMTLTRGLFFYT